MMKEAVSDWHTYGVWWRDSHTIIFYLDGREVGRQSPARGFDSPMYLFLDTEQHKGRLPTRAELSDNSLNTMLVDWVHAYTLQRR